MSKLFMFVLFVALGTVVPAQGVLTAPSRVYVRALACTSDSHNNALTQSRPSVTLYDISAVETAGFIPSLTVTRADSAESDFYFDVRPGAYRAFVSFPNAGRQICSSNGPLVVLPGRSRHIFVAGFGGLTDWHASGTVAGALGVDDVTVDLLVFERSMKCGNAFRALDQSTLRPLFSFQTRSTVIDDGAYYGNFYGYGQQDRRIALLFSGALFTEGAILITNASHTPAQRPPFIRKDVTPAIVAEATRARDKLVCVNGF